MVSVGEDLPKEQSRVRQLLGMANELKNMPGVFMGFAIAVYEAALKEADEAAVSGDPVRIVRAYQSLKDCE